MKKIILAILILILFQACKQKSKQFARGEGNMLYVIHHDAEGQNIMPGDFTELTVTEQTEDGKVLYNSNDYDGRTVYRFREPSIFKGDFFSGMGLLSEGDSATFKVKAEKKYLIYRVKVHKVISRGDLNDSLFNLHIANYKLAAAEKAKTREPQKINDYIKREKLKTVKRPSGLQYILITKGKGAAGKPKDTVKLNFTATYLGGKVFETNSKQLAKKAGIYNPRNPYGPASFLITKASSSGFNEALALFPKGTKAKLVIPSKLAYGGNFYGALQPYTPLLCEVEILDIISPKNH